MTMTMMMTSHLASTFSTPCAVRRVVTGALWEANASTAPPPSPFSRPGKYTEERTGGAECETRVVASCQSEENWSIEGCT
jgi:hypothetical protein